MVWPGYYVMSLRESGSCVTSDKVDKLWERIVKSTHARIFGISEKVSTRDEISNRHVICVYNADNRSQEGVNRVRDGLGQLGVKRQTFIHIVAYIWKIADIFRLRVTIVDSIQVFPKFYMGYCRHFS
jgi:Bles03-like protein